MTWRSLVVFAASLVLATVALLGWQLRPAAAAFCDITVYSDNCPPPTGSHAAVTGPGTVSLSWRYSGSSGSFSIFRSYFDMEPQPVDGSQRSYVDSGLAPGSYTYRICANYPEKPDSMGNTEPYYSCDLPVSFTIGGSGGGNGGGGSGGGNGRGGGTQPPANPPPSQPPACTLGPTVDPNKVNVYEDAGFAGQCAADPVAIYATAERAGLHNDTLSSFQIGANVQLVICEDVNFGGACSTYVDNDANMNTPRNQQPQPIAGPGMDNDHMSSMCVHWRDTPPGTPCTLTGPATDPMVTARTQTSLTISWTPGTGEAYQQVSCAQSTPSGSSCAALVDHDTASYTFTGLQPDSRHPLAVCSETAGNGDGGPEICSDIVYARTLPPAPSNVAASFSESGVDLSWDTNISDPASTVTYTITRDGTQVVSGLAPVRLPSAGNACPYLPFDPATGRANGACGAYSQPLPYPASVHYTDSTVDGSGGYQYTICAVDAQDDVVQACASFTAGIKIGGSPLNPNMIPIPGR